MSNLNFFAACLTQYIIASCMTLYVLAAYCTLFILAAWMTVFILEECVSFSDKHTYTAPSRIMHDSVPARSRHVPEILADEIEPKVNEI